ncbi:MAG: acetylornithine deacetylase [Gaiellales bacterium]
MSAAHELLEQLVAFPSLAGRPNDEIATFISGWLRGHGIECAEIRGESGRVNLLASTGPDGDGVLLAAHMDVVEVEGQPWSGDPWLLRRDGDRLVGRGSADMKGFLACAMRTMADATALALREPLRLAVSTDEEIGCVGVRDLLPAIAALPKRPRACLVGEPTGMRLVTAHKGKLALRATLRGSARHSSEAPRADNAVEHAAELVLALRDRGRELADGRCDRRFAIPHSTISVGPIHGGRALNVVPDHCTVEFEVRTLPGDDPSSLLPATGSAEIEQLAAYPGLDGEAGALGDLLGVPARDAIDFGTEAGLYAQLGIATVVCGPGDIGDAHRSDESVAIEQLDRCSAALGRVLTHLT